MTVIISDHDHLVIRGALESPGGKDTLVNKKLTGYIFEQQFREIADSSTNENAFDVSPASPM